jgi:Holliday junction resolvasome RuvABC endonuclease subunit
MKKVLPQYPRILAIAPSTRGFGFAVVEGLDMLVDWGVKSISGDKNTGSIEKVGELIVHYEPSVIALEDTSTKPFHRSERIRALSKRIVHMAERQNVIAALLSREQVKRTFLNDGQGTKHALAGILANKFPEELGFRLPPKRRPWMSEDYRMDIFDAVALALVVRRSKF